MRLYTCARAVERGPAAGGAGRAGVARVRMRVCKVCACAAQRMVGALPHNKKNEWNKWKNHFYEMKGSMSLHEKERNKKMPTPIHKVTHNPIPTSLFLQDHNMQAIGCQDVVLCLVHL